MLFVGLADTYGLVAYHLKDKLSTEARTDLYVRAGDGMYKDGCYFEVEMLPEFVKNVKELMDEGKYKEALLEIKGNCQRLWLPQKDASKSVWNKIPA